MRRALALLLVALAACSSAETTGDAAIGDSGSADGGLADAAAADADEGADAGDLGPRYLTVVTSSAALDGLLGPTGDVKYLSPVEGAAVRQPIVESCYFQNMRRYDYHLLFLRSFPELAGLTSADYRDLVLRRPTRIWWGGGVKLYPEAQHPTAGQGVLAWTVYHEVAGADRLNADDVVAVHQILAGCATFAPDHLAFLPTDPYQLSFAATEQASLAARGVAVVFPDQLR